MIVYRLQCSKSHLFEGWFNSMAAYDEQAAENKLMCPVCNDRKIEKAIMSPAVPSTVGERKSAAPDMLRQAKQFAMGLRKHVEENVEYVGKEFPDEARKIHYGESEERDIYGEASPKEAEALVDEGVEITPLPDAGDIN
ncbi:MAG TPA: DUF1178 family protein [Rhizomicrobium sp.]|nr:DUF1178 family protein [Rhizomicrobium sp.]